MDDNFSCYCIPSLVSVLSHISSLTPPSLFLKIHFDLFLHLRVQGMYKIVESLDNVRIKVFVLAALTEH